MPSELPLVRDKIVYTAGPSQVRANVRQARAAEMTNPDVDEDFFAYYVELTDKLKRLFGTRHDTHILCGECMLGLDAVACSLIEQGDRVLVLDNGVFGGWYADMVTPYGGVPVVYEDARDRSFDPEKLRRFLDGDHDFKFASIVHCDTPSGLLNDISVVCPILKSYGILTLVDAAASMFGVPYKGDDWCVDITVTATQKALSAEPGLTLLSISDDAWKAMEARKTPIPSYYCNLLYFKESVRKVWFPYTMSISDIYSCGVAVDNILAEGYDNVLQRHARVAQACRAALVDAGLELHLTSGFSATVTGFNITGSMNCKAILKALYDKHKIILSGSYHYLEGKLIRLGHMGENCFPEKLAHVLGKLQLVMADQGTVLKCNLEEAFMRHYNGN